MSLLAFHILSFLSLSSFSLYHLILSTRSFLRSPSSHLPRPYHPLPLPTTTHKLLRHLPVLLLIFSLLLSILFHLSLSFISPSSALSLSYLHTSLSLLLLIFILIIVSATSLPSDLSFLLLALPFLLLALSPSPSLSPSDLQTLAHSFSSAIALASSLLLLALALLPRLFLLELALAASLLLRALWSLQTALSLYADAFIPRGCHRLLDLAPATRCDLDETRSRAARILDLAFAVHVSVVAIVVAGVYLGCGGGEKSGRRLNGGAGYEALPTVGSAVDLDHVQMKALGKSAAQE